MMSGREQPGRDGAYDNGVEAVVHPHAVTRDAASVGPPSVAPQRVVDDVDAVVVSMVDAVANALSSIMAATQLANLLVASDRPGQACMSLDHAEEECLRAARLLREGRGLATRKLPPSAGVDVTELLSACAEACGALGQTRVCIDADIPLARGDADAVKRMFVEILANAFEFGAAKVAVKVTAEHVAHAVRVEFHDDGPGVRVQAADPFAPFVTSQPSDHSGLGLASAARIAAAYGGSIGLGRSACGAMFWVRLPAASTARFASRDGPPHVSGHS